MNTIRDFATWRLIIWSVMFIGIVLFFSCGGDDEPKSDITLSDLDNRLDDIEDEIATLRNDVAKGNIQLIEGAKPIDPREPTEVIQDLTGGLPPTGEPTGEPVNTPVQGVPVFGEGRIVFTLHGNDGADDGIYIMGSNGAGKSAVVLPEVSFRAPALSPDGQHIAYAAGHPLAIYIRHIESGREFHLTEDDGFNPAWSPDGRQIAYDDGSNLYISTVDMASPQVVKITHDGNFNTMPTWSPDGRQIAFASILDGNYNIFTIDVDGRNRIRLTNNPSDDEHPDWSPDGQQIAFMSHRHGTWDIFVVHTRTFVETQLTDSQGDYREPSWSPDGGKIAFSEEAEGEIYTIDADGTDLTNITNSAEYEGSPNW